MGFRPGAYIRLWEVKDEGKRSTGRITISKKDKNNPEKYNQEFNSYVAFVGQAHNYVKNLNIGKSGVSMRIANEVDATDVQDGYSAENGKKYHFAIFKIEDENGGSGSKAPATKTKATKKQEEPVTEDEEDSDLPF